MLSIILVLDIPLRIEKEVLVIPGPQNDLENQLFKTNRTKMNLNELYKCYRIKNCDIIYIIKYYVVKINGDFFNTLLQNNEY